MRYEDLSLVYLAPLPCLRCGERMVAHMGTWRCCTCGLARHVEGGPMADTTAAQDRPIPTATPEAGLGVVTRGPNGGT